MMDGCESGGRRDCKKPMSLAKKRWWVGKWVGLGLARTHEISFCPREIEIEIE